MQVARICLVRHGETDWNAQRRLQGHIDIELNAAGRAQASAAATGLRETSFHAAYSSDLHRAKQTAEILLQNTPLTPVLLPQLRERFFGAFQGLTYEEAQSQYPEAYCAFAARSPNASLPGEAETLTAFYARIEAVLNALAQTHLGKTLLVVTHGGALDMAYRVASALPLTTPRHFHLHNAALNWLIFHPETGWQIDSWGDRRHLGDTQDELAHA